MFRCKHAFAPALGMVVAFSMAKGSEPSAIGVNAKRPDGAIVLFDGSHGKAAAMAELHSKWHAWWRFNLPGHPAKKPSDISFRIARDPEFPNDTNHVTLMACCETAPGNWGYSDIQANAPHGDAQLHVEWMSMGRYDPADTENPDTATNCDETQMNAPCYFNSGIYVQSRYELQLQAYPKGAAISHQHSLGSIVNEFAPTSNQHRGNGVWQTYDITFRSARYRPGNHLGPGDTLAVMSVWWNGVQVHLNRRILGIASGLANHSGEEMNDTGYGLKLQDELGDVRFRNIWIKPLKIDSIGTNFGY